jgi:flagella basal body P-ring formation protein FlgA
MPQTRDRAACKQAVAPSGRQEAPRPQRLGSFLGVLLAVGILLAAPGAAAAAPGDIQIHLPRSIQIEADALTLGVVAIVHTADPATAERLAAIPLGRSPWSREQVTLDRPTILGRLAASGFLSSDVVFTGADKVLVTRKEQGVPADDQVKAAMACLAKERPAPSGCCWTVGRTPAELTVPSGGELTLATRMLAHEVAGEAKVEVAAQVAGRTVAAQPIILHLAYPERQAVATLDIPAGAVLTSDNLTVRTVMADRPQPADWTPPLGLVATQTIRSGQCVRPSMVRAVQPAVVVHRNENVTMRVQGAGFVVTALGQAIEDGRPGDFIKVRNVDSMRIVMARVAPDGSVEPVFDEVKK